MDPEIVYTRDGSVWPRGPRTEHWPGIYLSPHGRDVWVISDLRRTACVYALSGDKLSGDLRPERVQKWMVFEKDGGGWRGGSGWICGVKGMGGGIGSSGGDDFAIGGSGWWDGWLWW